MGLADVRAVVRSSAVYSAKSRVVGAIRFAIAPYELFYVLLQRYYVSGFTSGAIK
jgi:ABC-type glycerol-3-phosphate transport system permease component